MAGPDLAPPGSAAGVTRNKKGRVVYDQTEVRHAAALQCTHCKQCAGTCGTLLPQASAAWLPLHPAANPRPPARRPALHRPACAPLPTLWRRWWRA